MIDINNVTFRYSGALDDALRGINMNIGRGIYLLAGENGAGKTTLLHLIATLLLPTAGNITIAGTDTRRRLPSTLQTLFFLADDARMPADTIEALARLHARPFYPRFDAEMLADNLDAFAIDPRQKLDSMSLGQRKKALAAYALALRPDIILLDEPANGLDIGSRDTLRALFARCVEPEQTLIVSTHTTDDFRPLFDGIIMLRRGSLLFAKTTTDIISRLTFGVYPVPPRDALFTLNDIGRFRSITPATPDSEPTEIDIHLLYSALHSPVASDILNALNDPS